MTPAATSLALSGNQPFLLIRCCVPGWACPSGGASGSPPCASSRVCGAADACHFCGCAGPEQVQFETLCLPKHTAWRFVGKTRLFRSFWAGRRGAAASYFAFFNSKMLYGPAETGWWQNEHGGRSSLRRHMRSRANPLGRLLRVCGMVLGEVVLLAQLNPSRYANFVEYAKMSGCEPPITYEASLALGCFFCGVDASRLAAVPALLFRQAQKRHRPCPADVRAAHGHAIHFSVAACHQIEQVLFETLCLPKHTAWRFVGKTRLFRSLWAGRRGVAASRFPFFKGERL